MRSSPSTAATGVTASSTTPTCTTCISRPSRSFELLGGQIHELVLNYPVAQNVVAGLVGDLIGQLRAGSWSATEPPS